MLAGIAANIDHTLAFAPLDLANAGSRFARHEQRQRHIALRCGNLQRIERAGRAFVLGEAHANVDFLIGIIRAVPADQHTIGDQLHRRANLRNVHAELAGFGAVHTELILDAGKRPRVVNLDDVITRFQPVADHRGRAVERGRVIAEQRHLHVFAGGRTLFPRLDLEAQRRNGGELITHLGQRFARIERTV